MGVVLACGLLAAHHTRAGQLGLAASWLTLPCLLALRRRWVAFALRGALLVGAAIWLLTTWRLVSLRASQGAPYARLTLILGAVTLLTLTIALAAGRPALGRWLAGRREHARTSAAAFLLTLLALVPAQLMAMRGGRAMLLAERFVPGGGWVEVLLLATYAALIAERLAVPERAAATRRTIWVLFSALFFGQLLLGLLGVEQLLMRPDHLHLPIPALIAAGPIYRGGGYFMLALFLSTVLLVGPAWCSHLCYVGCWDNLAADRRDKPTPAPPRRHLIRLALALLVIGAAVGLRLADASPALAGALALAFGLLGVAVIVIGSRRAGRMVHCTVYCPIGLFASWLGRISPLRIRVGAECTRCMRCRLACRYGALERADIEAGRPGIACTLCGDCTSRCPDGQLHYGLLSLRPEVARGVFVALVVALHAASLGLARI